MAYEIRHLLNEAELDLGKTPPKSVVPIGFTINMCDSYKYKDRKASSDVWCRSTPEQQYKHLRQYINEVYYMFDTIVVSFELTKQGMVHAHAVGLYEDASYTPLYYLQTVRALVAQHPRVKKLKNPFRANYIHLLNDREHWVNVYMMKDKGKLPYPVLIYNKVFKDA